MLPKQTKSTDIRAVSSVAALVLAMAL